VGSGFIFHCLQIFLPSLNGDDIKKLYYGNRELNLMISTNIYPPQSTVTIVPWPRTASATSAKTFSTEDASLVDFENSTKTLVRVLSSLMMINDKY
jgi:hypothetical protein